MRPITFAIASGLICVLGLATLNEPLPLWFDAARGEVLILAGFGASAVLAAGRAPQRVLLSALLLFAAIVLQFTFVAILASDGASCGPEFSVAALFSALLLLRYPIGALGAFLLMLLFVYALARLPLRRRAVVVGALLLVLAGGTAAAIHFMPSHASHRCLDS